MTARVGDEIMITPQELHEPVRAGQIREVRNDPGGVVYLVQWSDTGYESLLPHEPDVVIKHRHTRSTEAITGGETPWLSRLRHPLEWRLPRSAGGLGGPRPSGGAGHPHTSGPVARRLFRTRCGDRVRPRYGRSPGSSARALCHPAGTAAPRPAARAGEPVTTSRPCPAPGANRRPVSAAISWLSRVAVAVLIRVTLRQRRLRARHVHVLPKPSSGRLCRV
jgi:hypothetical protein